MTSTILHVFRRRPFVYILNIFQGFHDYIRIDFVEQTPTVSEVVDIKREHPAIVFTAQEEPTYFPERIFSSTQ